MDGVPAEFVKWFMVSVIALVCVGLKIYSVLGKRQKQTVQMEPQPLEVQKAPKRYNKDLDDSRHAEIGRRLNGHDTEIDSLWNTMRSEDKSIREEHDESFKKIERSLGRIEGRLGIKGEA